MLLFPITLQNYTLSMPNSGRHHKKSVSFCFYYMAKRKNKGRLRCSRLFMVASFGFLMYLCTLKIVYNDNF